jgi:uncharacterized RDD family membrane protein YckC
MRVLPRQEVEPNKSKDAPSEESSKKGGLSGYNASVAKRGVALVYDFLAVATLVLAVTMLIRTLVGRTEIAMFGGSILIVWVSALMGWVYCASMEASPLSGTVGKLIMGIEVLDEAGGRIGFGQATGRHFAKLLTLLRFFRVFYWLRVLFGDQDPQFIHDQLANTCIVNR